MKPIFITGWLCDWVAKGRKGAEASDEWSCFSVWEKWADSSEVIGNKVKNWWCEVEGHRDPESCKEGLWDQPEKGINSNMCQPYIFQHLECFSDSSCWLRFRCIALSIISSLTNMNCSPVRMKTIIFHAIIFLRICFTLENQVLQSELRNKQTKNPCVCLALHKGSTKCLAIMNC